jgi:magnesium-transporting ATPase (P-type)
MGSGTDIAKEAGDIVITDNNIASIVKAVHFGRTIFKSIRKFIVFQLAMNLCAVGVSIICPFIGYESPISVIEMLWINVIIDTLAAIAFAGEAPLRSYMREKPIPKNEAVLSRGMLGKIAFLGGYSLILCLYFLLSPLTDRFFASGEERLLTGFFALFIFSGIIGSLNARVSCMNPLRGLGDNPVFLLVMSGVFTAQVAMIYYGGRIFGTVPLSLSELTYVMGLSLTVLPAGRLYELLAQVGRARTVIRRRGVTEHF